MPYSFQTLSELLIQIVDKHVINRVLFDLLFFINLIKQILFLIFPFKISNIYAMFVF